MSRLIVHLLPLLLPFLLYGLYIWHVKRSGKDGPEATPWFWLAAIGLVLMILSFVVYGAFSQHLRPSEDGVGGCTQFVRDERDKVVLLMQRIAQ